MATYIMSPQERLARAQTLKRRSENGYVYNPYRRNANLKLQEEKKRVALEEEKKGKNFFTRGLATIGDIASNVITGASKGLEGVYDLGASLVGAVGGIFDTGFQNNVKKHVAHDWTQEAIGNSLQELTKYSYTKDGGIIEGVASGIGQMLPAVAVSIATAGVGSAAGVAASAATKTAQVASLATLGVSAAGNSTEEAFNEGADYYKGLGYGVASGAVEVATEKMFGGATKTLFGKGVLDNVGKSVADTGLKRIAKGALEEGFEEVVSELANPALKGVYKGGKSLEEYNDLDYWKGVAKAGAIGSLTALAYSGTVGYGMSKVGMGYVGKEADINDSLSEIETQKKKADNLFANDKLTENNESTITSNLKGNYQNIETALKKSSETKRADMIKKFSLENAFESDGSMRTDFASKIGLIENVEQVSEDTTQDGSKPLASLDKRYYTPSLRGSEQTIQEDLGKITSNLQETENITALQEGREAQQISSVTPYMGELSDTGKASFTKVKKGLNYLNGKSGGKVNIVIINPHESFNGNLYNDQTIYLGADTLENGKWAGTLVHEYTHFVEGSNDYSRLIKFICGDVQLFETAVQATARAGYMSFESLDIIIGKIEAGKDLTADEARAYGTFQSEINAHMTETILGNEAFIGKIVRRDTTIAEKLLNKINDLKAMFKSFDSKESRAEYKKLETAERLYLKAVESAGYKYSNRKIIRTDKEEIDTESKKQYNRNNNILWEKLSKQEQAMLYERIDHMHHLNYTETKLTNGKYLIDIQNKVVITNGRFNSPTVEGVVEFNRFSEKISKARDYFYEQTTNGRTIREGVEFVNAMCEEEVATLYGYDNSIQNSRKEQQERCAGRYTTDNGRNGERKRSNGENKGTVRFSLKDKSYLSALTSGDFVEAQKVIDKTAKEAGYTDEVYHGTNNFGFTEFNPKLSNDLISIFASSEPSIAKSYGSELNERAISSKLILSKNNKELKPLENKRGIYKLYGKPGNRLKINGNGANWNNISTYLFPQIKNKVKAIVNHKTDKLILEDNNGVFLEAELCDLSIMSGDINRAISKRYGDVFFSSVYHAIMDGLKNSAIVETEVKAFGNYTTREISRFAKESGYDSVFIKDINDDGGQSDEPVLRGDIYIYFDAKSVKSADITTFDENGDIILPSKRFDSNEVDIRFSLKDSQGNALTQEQIDFFKDSKVRNKDGNLQVVYHGTNKEFFTFEMSKNSKRNVWGEGFYFAKGKGLASDYGENIIAAYLNIKNPYINGKSNLGTADFIKDKYFNEMWESSRQLGIDYITNKLEHSPIDLLQFIAEENNKQVADILNDYGYDGIIDGSEIVAFGSNQIKLTSNQNPTESVDIRYSRKPFAEQVDQALSNANDRYRDIFVMNTPQLLQDIGLDNLPMLMTAKHIRSINLQKDNDKHHHGVPVDIIKDIPNMIKTPVMVMESLTKSDSVVIIGERLVDNEPMLIAVRVDGKGIENKLVVDSNFITSAYGRHNFDEFIQKNIKNNTILFIDKKRSQELFSVLGVQFPEGFNNLNFNTIIRTIDKKSQEKNKNNSNSNSNDIRYSKKEEKSYYKLSEGQLKKIIANNTKYKTYTLADSETIINNVLSNFMEFGDKYGDLSGKTKKQVVDMLWKGLNSADPGYRTKIALNIADYIIQNGVLENIYGDADSAWAVDTIYALKPYLHSLDLSGISEEIKHRYDTDKSPYLLWGKRRGARGIAPDQLGQLLEDNGIQIDAINEADIFMQVNDLYKSAVSELKKKSKTFLAEGLSREKLKKLRQEIAGEVLKGFDYAGGDSKLANIVNKYTDRIRVQKEQMKDKTIRDHAIKKLLKKLKKLKEIELGTFLNATEFKNDIFKGSIEELTAIEFEGDLNKSGTRNILKGLAEWYVKSNNIVGEAYEQEIGDALNDIANGKGELTTQELLNLTNIVDYFKHFVETYNKVLRNGKLVEAQPIAEKYIQTINDNKAINVGWFKKKNGPAYVKIFGDPMSVVRRMDMYESGFYTEMLTRLREATVNAEIDEMNIRTELDEFLSKNKKYLKQASKRTVNYLGKDIPLMQALYVYMALGRKQAQLGLEKSGFTFTHNKETIRINGFDTEGKTAASAQTDIFEQLNDTDKHFVEIAKKIFNEECKERKRKTDIDRKGYSNVSEDEYIPIRRANIAKNVDASTFKEEMDRVSNASFNKDTVQGAAQELLVEPLNIVLDRHIYAVAQYANLSAVIDEYNTFFTLDISGNKNKPVSVATASQNTWKDGNEYFQKLISDIQGIPTSKGVGNRAMAFVRGNYAKYQLGCNPKVWLTQLSSFAAAGSILDVKSIIRGLGVASNDIDEYSQLAKLRNKENTAAMAQGVLSKPDGKVNLTKLNDFGDLLMKPIGMVDRFVVKRLFGACQVQVEKENGLKIGSVENKQKAAELLDKVILETQQNSMATERSAAMRSGNEISKTITMFSADAMKVVGRVIDSVGEVVTLRARRKIETDTIKIAELDKRINAALKKTAKSVASLVTSAVLMALIAQLFRTLYNKDDEDDNIAQNMAVDAIGNLLGGLPIIRDIYSRFTQGYEIDGYAYTMLNDLLDSGVGIFETVGDIFSGKANSKDIALKIKKLAYAGGQFLGLPTRNVYNIVYGLTKRISPSTAYKINDAFYNQSYSADLAKAVANNDDSMIATISGIMLDENVGEIEDTAVRKELNALVSKGHSVLPKSIGDKIIYNNEEIALTNRQREQFKIIYSEANSKVASLVNLSQYDSASDEARAKAIKYIYDIYYNLALEDLLGVELENKNLLFAEAIDIEKLAIIVASARALVADTSRNGKVVAGTKKAKVQAYVNSLQLSAAQKYMIMGYLGYTNAKGKNQVKSYIQRLSLSKARKQQLFEYSGYAA